MVDTIVENIVVVDNLHKTYGKNVIAFGTSSGFEARFKLINLKYR